MTASLEGIAFTVSLILSFIALATTVWNWLMSGARANAKQISAHAQRLDDHGHRLQRLEQTVNQMPGKDALHQLELHLVGMSGDMKAMRAAIDAVKESQERTEHIVSRHEDHLRQTP